MAGVRGGGYRRLWLLAVCAALLSAAACHATSPAPPAAREPGDALAASLASTVAADGVSIVVAPAVAGSVDEGLIRDAFRRVVAQGERDFGLRPEHTVTIYIDPDTAIGLEDALGLSQKSAIHLRAGHARNMNSLLPLLMHEYTHALQYQTGRLRPQWWVEGQADHEALRVRDPASAQRERRALYTRLADDVRAGRAPRLADLRGGLAWDEYIKKAGAGKAYGWGNAAVAFIEDRAGFEGVARILTDKDGPNTYGRFDELVREVTGLSPDDFGAAVKQWVVQKTRG